MCRGRRRRCGPDAHAKRINRHNAVHTRRIAMKSIAQFAYRRRRYVVVGWILALVGVFALSGAVGGEFSSELKLPGSESQNALDLLKKSRVNARPGHPPQVQVEA